jgi:RNA polymerase sigma-70 factor (ECF subfamily)
MDKPDSRAEEVIKLWHPIKKNAYRIVNSITRDPFLTEDVLQEALLAAVQKFDTLKDVNKFDKWFYTIAARIAYNFIKKRKRVVPVEEIYHEKEFEKDGNQNMDKALLLVEDNDEFIRLIKTLPQRERHLINLRFVQGMKIAEISKVTGIKQGTLKSIYHRAFKKLRELYIKEQRNG